jgi:hypothetical protein
MRIDYLHWLRAGPAVLVFRKIAGGHAPYIRLGEGKGDHRIAVRERGLADADTRTSWAIFKEDCDCIAGNWIHLHVGIEAVDAIVVAHVHTYPIP